MPFFGDQLRDVTSMRDQKSPKPAAVNTYWCECADHDCFEL